jgi:ribosomal protein L40E
MGDINVANTQTDQNGRYAFSVPVGANYFPAAFSNGAIVYTVVESHNSSFVDTPSAAISVPVNLAPLYTIIALITAAVVIVCYLFVRRFREEGSAVVGAARPSRRAAAPVVASGKTAEASPPRAFVRRLREKGSAVVGAARPSRRAAAPVVASGKTAEASPPALISALSSEGGTSSVGTTTEEPAPLRAKDNEKYCQNCGAKNRPYAAFCNDCGKPFNEKYCQNCGAKNRPYAAFCNDCGKPFNEKYCQNCGAKNRPHAAFCDDCGKTFIAPAAPVTESGRDRSAEDAGDATAQKKSARTIGTRKRPAGDRGK